jgi:hypothetical protein
MARADSARDDIARADMAREDNPIALADNARDD